MPGLYSSIAWEQRGLAVVVSSVRWWWWWKALSEHKGGRPRVVRRKSGEVRWMYNGSRRGEKCCRDLCSVEGGCR